MGIYPGTNDPFLGFDCIWLPKNKGCTRYRMQPQIFEKKNYWPRNGSFGTWYNLQNTKVVPDNKYGSSGRHP